MTRRLGFSIIPLAVKNFHFTAQETKKGEGVLGQELEVSFLLDFLVYYYDEDLSLSEIAENEGITRQGVRDAIKRAENQLFEMESRLGLAKKFETLKKGLEEIEQCAEAINAYNLSHTLSREINDNVARIKTLTAYLCE